MIFKEAIIKFLGVDRNCINITVFKYLKKKNVNYYITTDEIPGELLGENLILIFRLVKITVAMAT